MRTLGKLAWTTLFVLVVALTAGCTDTADPPNAAPSGGSPSSSASASPSAAPAPLSTRISLSDTEAVAGTEISGVLSVVNATDHPMDLAQNGCLPGWAIGLENDQIEFTVTWTANCVSTPFVFDPGTTDLPFTVSTAYSDCRPFGSTPSPGSNRPECLATDELPPLPTGEYRTTLYTSAVDPALPAPPAVVVQVLPA